MFQDVFNSDAFGLVATTAAINKIDSVPGRAGQLAFGGVGEGVSVPTVAIEAKSETLSLVATSPRGGDAPKETNDKANLQYIAIPQVKLEQRIGAHEVLGVRQFGTGTTLQSVMGAVTRQMQKMQRRFDMTLESFRLGALKGFVKDSDGSILQDLHALFGETTPSDFDFALGEATTSVRNKCQDVIRYMRRNVKTTLPPGWGVHAFCGDTFFDALINHATVKAAYESYTAAAERLGGSYAMGVFPFGGIDFENYPGTDDMSSSTEGTVGIHPDECRFFLKGVPGLYQEFYAPADFAETVNTVGLPRYAKVVQDDELNRYVMLHVQMNPFPICTRPKTLVRGVRTGDTPSSGPSAN